jgi:hypothetical protein
MTMDSKARMISMASILRGFNASVFVSSDVPLGVLGGLKNPMVTVCFSREFAVSKPMSKIKVSMIVDPQKIAWVLHGLELDVSGLVARVDTVDLPLCGLAITAVNVNVLVGASTKVLSRAMILQGDDTTIVPRESGHFFFTFREREFEK